jgi:hypothetical protein
MYPLVDEAAPLENIRRFSIELPKGLSHYDAN